MARPVLSSSAETSSSIPKERASARTCSNRCAGGVPTKRQPRRRNPRFQANVSGSESINASETPWTAAEELPLINVEASTEPEAAQSVARVVANSVPPTSIGRVIVGLVEEYNWCRAGGRRLEQRRRGPLCGRWAGSSRDTLVATCVRQGQDRRGAADRREPSQPEGREDGHRHLKAGEANERTATLVPSSFLWSAFGPLLLPLHRQLAHVLVCQPLEPPPAVEQLGRDAEGRLVRVGVAVRVGVG
eukprot:scaffold40130_cov49-Phaeocystis_antarctica.AAC.2